VIGLSARLVVLVILAAWAAAASCRSSPPQPARLDSKQDACASCRMMVSDARFASQVVAPFEEPRFFDDLGCLARYLQTAGTLPDGAVIYVADHATRAWVRADAAVFTEVQGIAAPMGSHVIAHESAASRDADPAALSGRSLSLRDVLPGIAPGGSR
jgi:copper chaperone NosL